MPKITKKELAAMVELVRVDWELEREFYRRFHYHSIVYPQLKVLSALTKKKKGAP